jgi:proteasome accessory factor C
MDADERTQGAETISPVPFLHGGQAAVVELAHIALNARQRVKLVYAGEGAEEPSVRVIQIHDVVASEGNHYLIAWCERAGAWRRFRADRVLEAELLAGSFEWRTDAPTIESAVDLFEAPPEAVDEVKIRFSPRISRWIRERYTDAEAEDDGSTVVTFRTSSIDWLVRSVLQYGDEAEVIEPVAYREAVKRAVGV